MPLIDSGLTDGVGRDKSPVPHAALNVLDLRDKRERARREAALQQQEQEAQRLMTELTQNGGAVPPHPRSTGASS